MPLDGKIAELYGVDHRTVRRREQHIHAVFADDHLYRKCKMELDVVHDYQRPHADVRQSILIHVVVQLLHESSKLIGVTRSVDEE